MVAYLVFTYRYIFFPSATPTSGHTVATMYQAVGYSTLKPFCQAAKYHNEIFKSLILIKKTILKSELMMIFSHYLLKLNYLHNLKKLSATRL